MSYGITPWDISGNLMNLNQLGNQSSFKQNWVVLQSGKKTNPNGEDMAFVPDHDINDVSWMDFSTIPMTNNSTNQVKQLKQKFEYEGNLNFIPPQHLLDSKHSLLEQELDKEDDLEVFLSQNQNEAAPNVSTMMDDEMESWLQYPVEDAVENSNINNSNGNGNTDLLCNSNNPVPIPSAPNSRAANAAANLALAAQRAAGLIPHSAGGDAFNRVRASTLPTITATSIPKWGNLNKSATVSSAPVPTMTKSDLCPVQKSYPYPLSESHVQSHPKGVSQCENHSLEHISAITYPIADSEYPFPPNTCSQDKLPAKGMQKAELSKCSSNTSTVSNSSLPLNFPQFSRPVAMYSRPNLQHFESTFCHLNQSDLVNVSRENNSSESSLTESTPVDLTCSYSDPFNSHTMPSSNLIQSAAHMSGNLPLLEHSLQQQQQYQGQQQNHQQYQQQQQQQQPQDHQQYQQQPQDHQQYQQHQQQLLQQQKNYLPHQQVQMSNQVNGVLQRLESKSSCIKDDSFLPSNSSGVQQFSHQLPCNQSNSEQNPNFARSEMLRNDLSYSYSLPAVKDSIPSLPHPSQDTAASNNLADHFQPQKFPSFNSSVKSSTTPYARNISDDICSKDEQWRAHSQPPQQYSDNGKLNDRDYILYAQRMALVNHDKSNECTTETASAPSSKRNECEGSSRELKQSLSSASPSPSTIHSNERLNYLKPDRSRSTSSGGVERKEAENFKQQSDSPAATTMKMKRAREEDSTNVNGVNNNSTSHAESGLENSKAIRATMDAASKRSRAAEVHNLSERRRRDRINEKMKELQNLIPNSNKTDKASMLDEAIEYLKMLQQQLQVMAMKSETDNQKWMSLQAMYSNHLYGYGELLGPLSCIAPMRMQSPSPLHVLPPNYHSQFGNSEWPLHPSFPLPPSVNPFLHPSGALKPEMIAEGMNRTSELASGGAASLNAAGVGRASGMESFSRAYVQGSEMVDRTGAGQNVLRSNAEVIRKLPSIQPSPCIPEFASQDPELLHSMRTHPNHPALHLARASSPYMGSKPPRGVQNQRVGGVLPYSNYSPAGLLNDRMSERFKTEMDSSVLQASSWNPSFPSNENVNLPAPSTSAASSLPIVNSFLLPDVISKQELRGQDFLYPESRSSMFESLPLGDVSSGFAASEILHMNAPFSEPNSKPVGYSSDACFSGMRKGMENVSRNF